MLYRTNIEQACALGKILSLAAKRASASSGDRRCAGCDIRFMMVNAATGLRLL
jgi:hypothetical protein